MTARDDRLLYWLARAHQGVFADADRVLKRRFGLGATRLGALLLAAQAGEEGVALGRVAEELGVGASAVTGLADRLTRDGLAHKRADPKDGRAARLTVTDKGRVKAKAAGRAAKALDRALTAGLSAEERAVVARFLIHVSDNAARLAEEVVDETPEEQAA